MKDTPLVEDGRARKYLSKPVIRKSMEYDGMSQREMADTFVRPLTLVE